MTTELRATRRALVDAEEGSYSPEHFPGSKAWMANKRAANAVDAFDASHPEIKAALKTEREARALAAQPAEDADSQRLFDAGLI